MRRDPNKWRYHLDPRDPDYLEPPTAEELEQQQEQAEHEFEEWRARQKDDSWQQDY